MVLMHILENIHIFIQFLGVFPGKNARFWPQNVHIFVTVRGIELVLVPNESSSHAWPITITI